MEDNPKPAETVVRILMRLPEEMTGSLARQHIDADDFRRRREYPRRGDAPENGLSLMRKSKFKTSQDIYNRVGSKKLMGMAACTLKQLQEKGLQFKVDGANQEHVSLRCAECDLTDRTGREGPICKPKREDSEQGCPFFEPDPYGLANVFRIIEIPAQRNAARKWR